MKNNRLTYIVIGCLMFLVVIAMINRAAEKRELRQLAAMRTCVEVGASWVPGPNANMMCVFGKAAQ